MRIAREVVRHPQASLRCLRLALPAFRGGLHRHGHVELTWIERGCGLRWVGDSVEPFGDGDLVLVGPDVPHLWATRGAAPAGGCAAVVVQFPADWALQRRLPELAPVERLFARADTGLAVEGPARPAAAALLARMAACDSARRVAAFIEVLAMLVEHEAALRPLSSHRPVPERDGSGAEGRRRRVEQVLDHVQARLADDLRVADLAAIAHVSPAAFGRWFRREVGKGFAEYVNDARCSWAALQLQGSDRPVAAIAQACGFPTLSNFGEQFRRRHGLSPRAWRVAARAR
jgi:AraC-like DNA-binding protein